MPNVTADKPRSENPFSITSTSTIRTPIRNPDAIETKVWFRSPAKIVNDTSQPPNAHSAIKTIRIGSRVLSIEVYVTKNRLRTAEKENDNRNRDHDEGQPPQQKLG